MTRLEARSAFPRRRRSRGYAASTSTSSLVEEGSGIGCPSSFNPSKWSSIASRISDRTSSFESPAAMHPGRSGTYAPKDEGPFSTTTRYRIRVTSPSSARLVSRHCSGFLVECRRLAFRRLLPCPFSSDDGIGGGFPSFGPETAIGLEEIDDGVWNVYFGPLKLGRLNERHMRIEDEYGRLKRHNV